MAQSREAATLVLAEREVVISNPDKLLFPKPKHSKLDLVHYYIAVAEGALPSDRAKEALESLRKIASS